MLKSVRGQVRGRTGQDPPGLAQNLIAENFLPPHAKIGILGGFFNPIHKGHTALGEAAAEALGLQKILLIPSAFPPHKSAENAASPEFRLEMCRLAAAKNPLFEVCPWELKRGQVSYTADTLEFLAHEYSDSELFLICGGDMFMTVLNWKNPRRILELAVICGAVRGDISAEDVQAQAHKIRESGGRAEVFEFGMNPISSTMIRERIARGEGISGLVEEEVEAFIILNEIYRG